ncbi:ribonuclease H family protein [Holzapfeliella sp. JNUCC 80]
MKYYAVKKGRKSGIYEDWASAKEQVMGYKGAIYKSFTTKEQAESFMKGMAKTASKTTAIPAQSSKTIKVFTDGGSRNTGNYRGGQVKATDKAAWAFLIKTPGQNYEGTGFEAGATNNRMEITALLKAMAGIQSLNLDPAEVEFILDSKYVLDAIRLNWLKGWAKNGFKRKNGELKNKELWQKMYDLLPEFEQSTFSWTKGHATSQGNVYVDELLNKTMDQN